MSNLIDEKGNEIGHPEQFDMSIYEEKIKAIRERTLEEQCSILADCNTCHSSCKNENAEMKEQLAKAKELIGELISSLSVVGECEEEECELLNRAEQFLSEVEE